MSNVIVTTDAAFAADVLESELPVVVRFTATWCGPCRNFAPLFAEAAEQFAGKIKFVTVDVDNCKDTALKYNVRGIPFVLTFKGGEPQGASQGAMPKSKFVELLSKSFPEHVGQIATGNGPTAATQPEGTGTSA
ncbi:Thioredoxin C-2 [compost metagenome]